MDLVLFRSITVKQITWSLLCFIRVYLFFINFSSFFSTLALHNLGKH
jgi:hypothetical protein